MASIPAGGSALILTKSKPLRLLTLLLFYFTQGFPIGLFFYAIPTWMAANGADTAMVASVVATSALPWSLKLVNGFLIDRYTFLAMGRRRAWIIGAQSLIVLILIAGAVIQPAYDDLFLLSALGFIANAAITFQDVGIDSLAVDIMEEDERAKAGGIMFGAQLLGIAGTTAVGGILLHESGISATLLAGAIVPGVVAAYGVMIREREGERRLPWTAGDSHPRNREIQVEAWWPLLVNACKAMIVPLSLLLVPILLFRSIPAGGFEAFHPILYQEVGGWELAEYTNFISSVVFFTGLLGLVVGGWAVDAIGPQRSVLVAITIGVTLFAAMGFAQAYWSADWVLMGFYVMIEMVGLFYSISIIPICMRMCNPAVAATQFTIYMAIGNFGRPLGALLAAATAGEGLPEWFYWSCGLVWLVALTLLLTVKFPVSGLAEDALAARRPEGHGLHPIED